MLQLNRNIGILAYATLSLLFALLLSYASFSLLEKYLHNNTEEKIQHIVQIVLINASTINQEIKSQNLDQNELQVRLNNLLHNLKLPENFSIWFTDSKLSFLVLPINVNHDEFLKQGNKDGIGIIHRAIEVLQSQDAYMFKYKKLPSMHHKHFRAIENMGYMKNIPESNLIIGCETSLEEMQNVLRKFLFILSTALVIFILMQALAIYIYYHKHTITGSKHHHDVALVASMSQDLRSTLFNLKRNKDLSNSSQQATKIKQNLQEATKTLKLFCINTSINASPYATNIEQDCGEIESAINFIKEASDALDQMQQDDCRSILIKEIETLIAKSKI
jgi:hypothetical protein